ncbi:RluA family pseudouridine synthase [Piscibacillus halophilus]|uniref:Pseudouridine synthase n=1 Tax=Piscibacillus halophilus TaxID=571933 RepID=A0A1H9B7F3_9BACI|nr:RluA family pseudouridine synthase [Piscibacillus halophilus]SEP84779.1 23S rRNA pseudouridine1911/1915/1917 synthase [Piscibacillus halophilus]
MRLNWRIKSKDEGKLVREYLLHDRAFSNRLLKDVKMYGHILVDGEAVTVKYPLKKNDRLCVHLPEENNHKKIKPVKMDLNVVYEDDFLLIINKPRGLAVLPNMNDSITLANGLVEYFKKNDIKSSIHIVTRLDKWTSGLVLIAKNRYSHHLLTQQNIHREYRAIVEGHLRQKKGVIDLPIARNLPSIIERKVDQNGKRAITHYQVIKEMDNRSFISVRLETGRTHQIRVHFSHIGHPLVGDDLYCSNQILIEGQALHARSIQLMHPINQTRIHCVASYPEVFIDLVY